MLHQWASALPLADSRGTILPLRRLIRNGAKPVMFSPFRRTSPELTGKRPLIRWNKVDLPDSFGPRGQTSVCGRGTLINGSMRVADVAGALDFLNAQIAKAAVQTAQQRKLI